MDEWVEIHNYNGKYITLVNESTGESRIVDDIYGPETFDYQ